MFYHEVLFLIHDFQHEGDIKTARTPTALRGQLTQVRVGGAGLGDHVLRGTKTEPGDTGNLRRTERQRTVRKYSPLQKDRRCYSEHQADATH